MKCFYLSGINSKIPDGVKASPPLVHLYVLRQPAKCLQEVLFPVQRRGSHFILKLKIIRQG